MNRLDNLGYDGVQIAKDIHTMVKAAGYEAEVLGASFKNSQQVLEMGKFGIGSVTVNPDTLKALAFNGVAETAVKDFIHDFEDAAAKAKQCLILNNFILLLKKSSLISRLLFPYFHYSLHSQIRIPVKNNPCRRIHLELIYMESYCSRPS